MVKIILHEDVESLGDAGEIVDVKLGYARNYLLPRKKAVLVTMKNLEELKEKKEKLREETRNRKSAAEATRQALEAIEQLEFAVKVGPTGKLYGRITSADISDLLQSKHSISLNKKDIKIKDCPFGIEEMGKYHCTCSLYVGISAQVNVQVVEASS